MYIGMCMHVYTYYISWDGRNARWKIPFIYGPSVLYTTPSMYFHLRLHWSCHMGSDVKSSYHILLGFWSISDFRFSDCGFNLHCYLHRVASVLKPVFHHLYPHGKSYCVLGVARPSIALTSEVSSPDCGCFILNQNCHFCPQCWCVRKTRHTSVRGTVWT